MNDFDFDLQRFADRVISGENYTVTAGGTYKIASGFTGTITIDTTAAVTIDGTNAGALTDVNIFAKSSTANLTIKNLTVTNETGSVIRFGSGTGNKLTLAGTNSLKTSDTWAAVVNVGGGLTIGGSGSLNVTAGTQGPGIGINSYDDSTANIIINGGTITATADMGAGIGSGSNGSIGNITINAVSVNTTSIWGKGVGAGYGGSAGNVTITIVGDVGDDILIGTPETDTFAYTGGNDVITNYGPKDTVHIKSGKIDNYSFEGSDLIFHVGNGSLRLNNMTNHAITVKDSAGKTTTQVYGTSYSGHEVMKRFVHSMANSKLDTKAKLDEAIKACSHFNSLQEVIDQIVADCWTANDADIFLRKYCGIIDDNADNGSAIGWDAGGLSMKTSNDLYTAVGDAVYPDSTVFTIRGLTITVPEKDTLTEQEQFVVKGFYSWWAEDAIRLVEESYGVHFSGQKISLSFMNDSTAFGAAYGGADGITVNMAGRNIEQEDLRYYLSSTIAHEMTHVMQGIFGVMSYSTSYMYEGMANLTEGSSGYAFANDPDNLAYYLNLDSVNYTTNPRDYRCMYTVGYMFWRYLMRQASDSYDSSKNYSWKDNSHISGTANGEFLTGSGTNVTIVAGAGNDTLTVYGKNMKAFGEEGADCILIGSLASGASIDGGLGNDSIDNSGSNVTINGGAGSDSINCKGDSVKIFGGADNDIILVEKTSDYNWSIEAWEFTYHDKATIDGGLGNDTIDNSGNKVTLDGGTGSDSINSKGDSVKIFGGADNDIILVEKTSDYNWDIEVWEFTYHDKATIDGGTGNDSIKNENSNASINGGTGNDTIENHGDKTILQGGAGSDMLINGEYFSSGGVKVSISGGDGNDTLTNSGSNSVLYGGAGNDLIHNGYYYYRDWNIYYDSSSGGEYNDSLKSSNVTLDGGAGNDTIDNRGSNVSLNGGAGNDTITNYGTNVTIDGGKGNDTLTGGKGADVFVYTAGKDVISDYASGDKISLGAAITATAVSGSNVVFTIGKGKLTVKDAKGKKLTLINSAGKTSTTTISDLQTVTNSTKSPVTAKSYVKTI
ncbi:MAG: calcium-binding protein, partial [Quinella sp. 1Q7]|nr:calcium-binding protein [Quinella sp. 1Q7]